MPRRTRNVNERWAGFNDSARRSRKRIGEEVLHPRRSRYRVQVGNCEGGLCHPPTTRLAFPHPPASSCLPISAFASTSIRSPTGALSDHLLASTGGGTNVTSLRQGGGRWQRRVLLRVLKRLYPGPTSARSEGCRGTRSTRAREFGVRILLSFRLAGFDRWRR